MSRWLRVVLAAFSSGCLLASGQTSSELIQEGETSSELWTQKVPVMPKGVVKLDGFTLEKARDFPGVTWLVMLDLNYSTIDLKYPLRATKFDAFSQNTKDVKDFMIGKIPVQSVMERGELPGTTQYVMRDAALENVDLIESLGVIRADLPVFLLFKGKFQTRFNPPCKDEGERRKFYDQSDWNDLVEWLRSQGTNVPSLRTIGELDKLVIKFKQTGFSEKVVEEARELAEGEHKHDRKAAVYVRVMEKIQHKGIEYIAHELERVTKIERESNLTPEQRRLIKEKIYILRVFDRSTWPEGTQGENFLAELAQLAETEEIGDAYSGYEMGKWISQ